MTVAARQRFSGTHPCPICGGYGQRPRGTGERCFGFLSDDGRFAHCTREEFAGALQRNPASQAFAHGLQGPCGCGQTHSPARPGPGGKAEPREAALQTWDYWSADGRIGLFQVYRYEASNGKSYGVRRLAPADWRSCQYREQCRKEGVTCADGWIGSLKARPCSPAVAAVLYSLPLLTAAEPGDLIAVAEGEKCAEALSSLGFMATTSPFGAGKWRSEYSERLTALSAAIFADADGPGRDHVQQVAGSLWGKAKALRVVDLHPDRDDGSDVADWIAERQAAGLDDGAIRAELEALIAQAPDWRPSQDDSAAGTSVTPPSETSPDAPIFLTPEELASGHNAGEVDWLWEGFLAPGHITLLAGKPRASGKSTLTFGLLRALICGEAFLGFTTRQLTAAVFLSEEARLTLLDKTALFGLSQSRQLRLSPRDTSARLSWEEAIGAAVAEARRVGAELLVVDSFPHFAKLPKDGAKDSSLINEAFRPLQAAAAAGLAVLLIHHERKGGGEAGEGVRDSGAIVASSDIILELGRIALDRPSARKLELLSRFRSTPTDFAFEFDKDTGEYTYLATLEELQDSQKQAEREVAARRIADLLPAGPGLTQKEVGEKAALGKSQVGEVLNKAVGMGLAGRTGRGTRNDPYRYCRLDGTGSEQGAGEDTASGSSQSPELPAGANQDSDVSADALMYTDRRKRTAGSTAPSPPGPPPPSGSEAATSDQTVLPMAPAAGGQ